MNEYFPEPKYLGGKVKIELDLSNYAIKADLKYATGVDAPKFAKKVDLASLKSEVDILDKKFETTPFDLRKLNNVIKNDVFKKTVYDELAKKVNVTQTTDSSKLVKKIGYDIKINEIEKKIANHNHDKDITTQ